MVPASMRGVLRFIPACAGNSNGASEHARCFAVHPRVCGEQTGSSISPPCIPGSSPRVRGTARFKILEGFVRRFIPACAGNSGQSHGTGQCCAVHPRVCGEQSTTHTPPTVISGSSPRVRGTGRRAHSLGFPQRFIPACAGNSVGFTIWLKLMSVHPRVCGEQSASRYF